MTDGTVFKGTITSHTIGDICVTTRTVFKGTVTCRTIADICVTNRTVFKDTIAGHAIAIVSEKQTNKTKQKKENKTNTLCSPWK